MSEALSEIAGGEAPAESAPAESTPAPAQESGNWLEGIDESSREFLSNKGWAADSPVESLTRVMEGYRNAEKMIGGRVKIPEPGDEDGWSDLYKRLGRPDSPDQYELSALPEEQDEKLVGFFRTAAHKAGFTPQQANAFLAEYNNFTTEQQESIQATISAESAAQLEALKTEWGPSYGTNIAQGRRAVAAAQTALGEDGLEAIENAIGTSRTLKLFASLGKSLSEDGFVEGGNTEGFSLSPARAQERLSAKKNDPNFMARYMRGDAGAVEEFTKLFAAAHGGREDTV